MNVVGIKRVYMFFTDWEMEEIRNRPTFSGTLVYRMILSEQMNHDKTFAVFSTQPEKNDWYMRIAQEEDNGGKLLLYDAEGKR